MLIDVLEGIERGIAGGVLLAWRFLFFGDGVWCCEMELVPSLGTAGRGRTVAAGDGLDKDLHCVFRLGAGGADAGDARCATHDGGCSDV